MIHWEISYGKNGRGRVAYVRMTGATGWMRIRVEKADQMVKSGRADLVTH